MAGDPKSTAKGLQLKGDDKRLFTRDGRRHAEAVAIAAQFSDGDRRAVERTRPQRRRRVQMESSGDPLAVKPRLDGAAPVLAYLPV
jgi:hypothetical protein